MKVFVIRISVLVTVLGLVVAGCATAEPAVVTTQAPASAATPASVLDPLPAPTASARQPGASTVQPAANDPTGVPSTGGEVIVYNLVPDQSSADYRVREQLANISFPTDAVGKTSSVSGSLAIQPGGKILSDQSKFVVDLSSLQSDKSMRDNFVRGNVLQTSQYPQAVFVPTSVSGLPSPLPQSGSVTFQLTGDLTIRDVTKPVTWDVKADVQGNQVTGLATTTFTFEDFNLSQPRVPVVLSVEDHITLELNFTLQK